MDKEFLLSTLQLLNKGVIITDSHLTIQFVNKWIEEKSGRSTASLIGKNIAEAFPELKERNRLQFYERALRGESVIISQRFHQFIFLFPSGIDDPSLSTMLQSVRIAPILIGDRSHGVVTIIEDVTERVLKERALQDQAEKLRELNTLLQHREQEYRTIVEHIGDIILVVNSDFFIQYASPSFQRVLNRSPDDLFYTSLLRWLSVEDSKKIIDIFSSIQESGRVPKTPIEITLQDREGTLRYFDVFVSFVKREEGDPSSQPLWILVLHETTERVNLAEQLKLERDFIKTVLDTVDVLVVGLDPSGRIVIFNRACEELTGFRAQEVVGKFFWEFLIPKEQIDGVIKIFDELRFDAIPNRYENHWLTKSGEKRLIAWRNSIVKDADGRPKIIIGTGIDVTLERAIEKELRDSKEELIRQLEVVRRKNRILGLLSELNEELMISKDEDDIKRVISKYLSEIFSQWSWVLYTLDGEKAVLLKWVSGGEHSSEIPEWIESESCWAFRISRIYECRGGISTTCGAKKWRSFSLCAPILHQSNIFGVMSLCLSQQLTDDEWQFWKDVLLMVSRLIGLSFWSYRIKITLKEQSILDPLTGLYNRRYLEDFLKREYSRAIRGGFPVAILMVDIDHFKEVNDQFGHIIGDEVLKHLANILRGFFRLSDLICRYGGEEFLIVCPDMDIEVARERAEKLRKRVESTTFPLIGGRITVSIGVAVFPRHGDTINEVIERADEALYAAKGNGRNLVMTGDYPSNFPVLTCY
ncbi:MAG: diguanylate cyclase [Syntrophobacterales bacterium]|nr:diguanylate cyclase [Syntrophobacterales bacterium]